MTFALRGAAVAQREETAEAAVGGAVAWPCEDVGRAVTKRKTAADGVAKTRFLRREVAAHHPGKRVPVGDGDAGEAEFGGGEGKLLRVRAAGEEGEIGGDGELGEFFILGCLVSPAPRLLLSASSTQSGLLSFAARSC